MQPPLLLLVMEPLPLLITMEEIAFAFYCMAVSPQPKSIIGTVLFPPAQHVKCMSFHFWLLILCPNPFKKHREKEILSKNSLLE